MDCLTGANKRKLSALGMAALLQSASDPRVLERLDGITEGEDAIEKVAVEPGRGI